MAEEFLPAKIADALHRGATVVTSNERAARTLARGYDRQQRASGLHRWTPAPVLAWGSWTSSLWRHLVLHGRTSRTLLNRTQEHILWRRIIAADAEIGSLRPVDALAEMAAEAWQRLRAFCGYGRRFAGSAESSDARAFVRWSRLFEERCKRELYMSQAELDDELRGAAAKGWLAHADGVAGGVALVGFDRMTPSRAALVKALREADVEVTELELEVPSRGRMLVRASDETEELETAARWCRALVERDPEARIALIVPGLELRRTEIDRTLRELVAPELQNIVHEDTDSAYEFSLGVPLARTWFGVAALDLLRWAAGPIPLARVSALLLSPVFGDFERERCGRAEFDAYELRGASLLRPEISIEWLLERASRSSRRERLQAILGQLRAIHRLAGRVAETEQRPYAEWADVMRQVLAAAAGDAHDSVDFQMRRRWEGALDELTTLDFEGVRVRFVDAVDQMERVLRQTLFAPESRDAPVQVMGELEAAGSGFDAVWLLGAGDQQWPIAERSNPLLGWRLQRELGMPGTDPTREMLEAREVARGIAGSAPVVIFSYPAVAGEARQKASSALLGLALGSVSAGDVAAGGPAREVVALEVFEDAARLPALPDRPMRGGAAILATQAACGFRAFAENRLFATEIDDLEAGLDARESGTVVHKVLEEFWQRLETQSALKAMATEERDRVLRECIEHALEKTLAMVRTRWDAAYVETQRQRLFALILPWLDIEMERPPFRVELSEKRFDDVAIGPLRLNVRVDRVDVIESVTEDGAESEGRVILDYKTGEAKPGQWLSERPDAPQLPLYAVLAEKRLDGVAFAQIRAGRNIGLQGFQASDGVLPKWSGQQTLDLAEHVVDWRRVLTQLAEDFSEGRAMVSPKDYPTTCVYCAQRLLCRLDVSQIEVPVSEEGDDEDEGEGRG